MNSKFGIALFVLSLVGLSFGVPTMTGNVVNEYFIGKFFGFHLIGLIFFFVSLVIMGSQKSLDAIIVPTGPSYEADRERARAGIKEYDEDKSRLVIISGEIDLRNGQRNFIGSQPMKIYEQMRQEGVPKNHFIFESKSHNTQENVLYTCEKIKEEEKEKGENIKELIIVTDKPQARRFRMLFDKAKKQKYIPKNLEIKTYSEGIKSSYGPIKAQIAYLKDLFTFDKYMENHKNKSKN